MPILIYLVLTAVGFYLGRYIGSLGLCLLYFFAVHSRQTKEHRRTTTQEPLDNSQSMDWAYQTLGVDTSADWQTIKNARKKLLNHYHPDKLGGVDEAEKVAATQKVYGINRAYHKIKEQKGNHDESSTRG